jgi:LTXXQ motif family protein
MQGSSHQETNFNRMDILRQERCGMSRNAKRGHAIMRAPIKLLLVVISLATVASSGFVALLDRSTAQALPERPACEASVDGSTRIEHAFADRDRCDASAAIELAQAFGPHPLDPPMPDGHAPMWHLPGPPPAFAGRIPHREPRLSPRRACEDGIHRNAALVGYLKSKLRLQGPQKDAWQKIEQAAEPAVESMYQLCAQLPDRMVGPAPMPRMIELAEKQLSARAAVLLAILEPARSLYELLSADQRAEFELLPPPGRF